MQDKNFIEHIIEPRVLSLVWQSSKPENDKKFVVAKLYNNQDKIDLQYLKNTKDFIEALNAEFQGYSVFGLESERYDDVSQLFFRRLPPRKREDFDEYLESFRIKPGTKISDFALLGYTAAKLPSDSFSILHTFEGASGPFEFLLEVTGFPFDLQKEIEIGQFAEFEKETNDKELAIKIKIAGLDVGYITRGLVPIFSKWLDEKRIKKAIVEKKNGTYGKPILFLYIAVE